YDHRPLARKPVQQRKVNQLPDARLLPISQAPPTSNTRTTAQLLRQHLPRNSTTKNKQIPLKQARSGRRGRPPCGLGLVNGKRGSITCHKPLGTSAPVITVHLHGGRRSDCPSLPLQS